MPSRQAATRQSPAVNLPKVDDQCPAGNPAKTGSCNRAVDCVIEECGR